MENEEWINNIKIDDDDFILDIFYYTKANNLLQEFLTRCFESSREKYELHTLRSLVNRKDIDTIVIRKYKRDKKDD